MKRYLGIALTAVGLVMLARTTVRAEGLQDQVDQAVTVIQKFKEMPPARWVAIWRRAWRLE